MTFPSIATTTARVFFKDCVDLRVQTWKNAHFRLVYQEKLIQVKAMQYFYMLTHVYIFMRTLLTT